MYGTAVNLAILALGSIGFAILLIMQTVSTEHKSPPMTLVAVSLFAFVAFAMGAAWAALLAKRAKSLRAREFEK